MLLIILPGAFGIRRTLMKKMIFLICLILANLVYADYGSVDIRILYKYHPANIFYFLPYSGKYISPSKSKIRAFNSESLFKLKYQIVKKIHDNKWSLSNKIFNKQTELGELNRKKQKLLYQYSNKSFSDEEFLNKQRDINKEISNCKRQLSQLENQGGNTLLADEKEEKKIKKNIFKDIKTAIKNIKREKSVQEIIFTPEAFHSVQSKKNRILDLCLIEKNTFTSKDRMRFEGFLKSSFKNSPEQCIRRDRFILVGGSDYTIDALLYIYKKNKVSKDITEYIFKKLGGR